MMQRQPRVYSMLAFSIFYLASSAIGFGQVPDRQVLLRKMEEVMGPMPPVDRKVPLDLKVHSEEKLENHVRKKISFASELNDRIPAWLLIPTAVPPT